MSSIGYRRTPVRVTIMVAWTRSKERRALAGGVHIVVGTPELRDHLERGALDLSALRVAVLDEADEMLDMGFREELEEILDATPQERRTLLFSATIPRPIVALAKRYQKHALRIENLATVRGIRTLRTRPWRCRRRTSSTPWSTCFASTRRKRRSYFARRGRPCAGSTRALPNGLDAVALSGEHSQHERNQALQALRDQRARVCVATDVAARGIDLPSVSLVIHVELPRDAEALQHRSGRTGRAGRKGTAILIVPYQRRKRVEGMLRGARISAEWIAPPTAAEIRTKDRDRLLAALAAPVELEDEDHELARQLLEKLGPEAIAAALVKSLRKDLPAPEDVLDPGQRPERGADAGVRPGFEGANWFRLNAGRRHNADPRWLLPLICRYGHVGRADVGAIRIAANESYFQVSERATPGFMKALRRATIAPEDQGLVIEPAAPREQSSTYRPDLAREKPRPKRNATIEARFRPPPSRAVRSPRASAPRRPRARRRSSRAAG